MTHYLDASAILPTLVFETSTHAVETFLATMTEPPILSSLAVGEVGSSIGRLVRMGLLEQDDALERLADFDYWRAAAAQVIDTEPSDMRVAALLVRQFDLKLRMPDAIHAAACRRLGAAMVTFDRRLAVAARALNIETIVPE